MEVKPTRKRAHSLGNGVIDVAFRWAQAADPEALLLSDDYNIAGEDGSIGLNMASRAPTSACLSMRFCISFGVRGFGEGRPRCTGRAGCEYR